ncbi:hypothetical protein GGI21_001267 [Coemansia aciculifera]|nr:hypothetical protein GGI21_001267 [Coemansia aciculifera]
MTEHDDNPAPIYMDKEYIDEVIDYIRKHLGEPSEDIKEFLLSHKKGMFYGYKVHGQYVSIHTHSEVWPTGEVYFPFRLSMDPPYKYEKQPVDPKDFKPIVAHVSSNNHVHIDPEEEQTPWGQRDNHIPFFE